MELSGYRCSCGVVGEYPVKGTQEIIPVLVVWMPLFSGKNGGARLLPQSAWTSEEAG